MDTRDANTKGGSLESGTSFKEKMPGQPDMAAVLKKNQKPPAEHDKKVARGHKLRTNTQGY